MGRNRRGSAGFGALVAVAVTIATPSCAPAPQPPPPLPAATATPLPLPTPEPAADLWDAPRGVLAEAGFEVVSEDRAKGVLVARRRKTIVTAAERREAAKELSRIAYLDDPRVGGAANRMTESVVTVNVRMGGADSAEFSMGVKAEIAVVDAAKRDGKTVPVTRPVPSRGVLEKELLAKIRERLEQ